MCSYQLSKEQLYASLAEQREFISSSCELFDCNHPPEGKRLATTIATLVHDPIHKNSKTKSILSQLGYKDNIRFLSSGTEIDYSPHIASIQHPLTTMLLGQEGLFYEPLCWYEEEGLPIKEVGFTEWWEMPVIKFGSDRTEPPITRKSLILSLRDQDGGSHMDSQISESGYYELAYKGNTGWSHTSTQNPGPNKESGNIHLSTARQIAWEVEQTLLQIDSVGQ